MVRRCIVMAALLCLIAEARADELLFRNGDHLSGTVVSMTKGKLTFESAVLGKLEIDVAQLQNLSTVEPIEIHMADGTVFTDQAVPGEAGELRTAGSSPIGVQVFALAGVEAINPPPPEPVAWHGTATAAVELKRGNTIEDNAEFKLDAERESDLDRVLFKAEYDAERTTNADTGMGTTNERKIEAEAKYDYFLGERWYWFGRTKGTKDGVRELDLRFSAGAGPGYRWWNTERTRLETEFGLTWVSEHYKNSDDDEDFVSALFSWNFKHKLTDKIQLFSTGDWWVDVDEWDDRFFVDAEFGLRDYLTPSIFLEAKVEWDYDSEPSGNVERQDVEYNFGVGYEF